MRLSQIGPEQCTPKAPCAKGLLRPGMLDTVLTSMPFCKTKTICINPGTKEVARKIVTHNNTQNISLNFVQMVECNSQMLTFPFGDDIIQRRKGLFSLTEANRVIIAAAESIVFDETILSAAVFIGVFQMQKKINLNFTPRDVVLVLVGIFIMGLGSALSYKADIGTSSIGTIVDGLHILLNISHGMADILVCLVLLIPMFFMAKDLIGIGTLISVFGIGLFIDMWKPIIELLPIGNSWPVRIALSLAGLVISSFGTSIYVTTGAGISSFDAVIMLSYRLTGLSYSHASIVANYAMLAVGWLIGGTVGFGTLFTILIGGYVSGFFMQRTWKYINKPSPLNRGSDGEQKTDSVI